MTNYTKPYYMDESTPDIARYVFWFMQLYFIIYPLYPLRVIIVIVNILPQIIQIINCI